MTTAPVPCPQVTTLRVQLESSQAAIKMVASAASVRTASNAKPAHSCTCSMLS